jgi:glycosyltransferase involved in cell wall biosynthesis
MNVGIAIPCYNEEHRIDIKYWKKIIEENERVIWTFVDDGSRDNTLSIIRDKLSYPNVSIVSLKKNLGKSEAVRFGMQRIIEVNQSILAIGFLDSDSAFTVSDIRRMVGLSKAKFSDENSRIDSLISSRVKLAGRDILRDSKRHYISRVLLTIINWNWREAPYDTQSGFKIFRNSESLKKALELPFQTKWFVDLEIFARIGAMKGPNQIWEEPAEAWQEVPGSKIGWKAYIEILKDILMITKISTKARKNI